MIWKDEFCRVSNPPQGGYYYSLLWGIDLRELKADGFAQWLTGTLCGPDRDYGFTLGGYRFMYGSKPGEGDESFSQVFGLVVPGWNEELFQIAREGVAKAVSAIDADVISYDGIAEMLDSAAILGMKDEFEILAPLFLRKQADYSVALGRREVEGHSPATP